MDNNKKLKILWARIDALEKLLVCYRVGRSPSEKLHVELDKTKKVLENNALELLKGVETCL